VLGHDAWAAAGIKPIGDWRDALARAFPAMLAGNRERSAAT
jgi:dTDP-4-dehydrorhamnose reductase